jgi:hypothetical protein
MAINQQPQVWAGGIAKNYFANKFGYSPKLNNENGSITLDGQPIYKAPNVVNGKTMINQDELSSLTGALDNYAKTSGIAPQDAQTSPLYQSMEKRAMALGRAGAGDVITQRSAQTWGMPNSDASTRGNEVYQRYINDAMSSLPQIQEMYNNQAMNTRKMYQDQQQQESDNNYRKYTTDYNISQDKLKTQQYNDSVARQNSRDAVADKQWGQEFNAKNSQWGQEFALNKTKANQAVAKSSTPTQAQQNASQKNIYNQIKTNALKQTPEQVFDAIQNDGPEEYQQSMGSYYNTFIQETQNRYYNQLLGSWAKSFNDHPDWVVSSLTNGERGNEEYYKERLGEANFAKLMVKAQTALSKNGEG